MLAKIEEEHGAAIKKYKEAQEKAASAASLVAEAEKNYNAQLDKQRIALDGMAVETNNMKTTVEGLRGTYEKAQEAADKEAEETRKRVEEETKLAERRKAWMKRIDGEVKASKEEYLELQKAANDALEKGLSDAEVEKALREKWLQLMDRRNKAEEDTRKKEEGKDPEKQQQNGSMSVSLDKGSIDDSADENSRKTEKVMKFGQWKREQRDEQRKIRDRNNSIRTNQPQMMKYLKDEMDKNERENWKNFIGKNLSEEETVALANAARKGELMSSDSKDWQRQSTRVNALVEAAFAKDKQEKMQKAAEDTATNTKEINDNLKKKRLR